MRFSTFSSNEKERDMGRKQRTKLSEKEVIWK